MEYISSYEARICKAKNKKEKAKRKKDRVHLKS